MRIRNSRIHLQRSLSPPPPSSSPQPSNPPSDQQPPQHIMVSRINARLSSIDNGSDSKDTIDSWSMSTNDSFGHTVFVQTSSSSSSVSSSLSLNGRWCEEEKAKPLKKRRVVMDALMEERNQNQRCNRENGKGWRCNKMRVKGRSLCNHHLEMQRTRNTHCATTGNEEEEEAEEEEGTTSFAVSGNQKGEKKRVKVVKKARCISSLLRDTVPLF
ncbi:WCRKC thioredoxin 1 isoform 1 [Hibiscus syriacus]|uniref:WCRKC thioredoxin 1 isoform 1 n=1 Tax=Hibiscus syriacus TaxID=106335 RepID=A0A6A3CQE3_HIBSY|nr:WCRKC thioredoxin 1 isoform 1 [Hibiscus syriacus]